MPYSASNTLRGYRPLPSFAMQPPRWPASARLVPRTNLPFEIWTEVPGSYPLTGAMIDRLPHRVHTLATNG